MKRRAIYIGPERTDASRPYSGIRYGMTGWVDGDKFYPDGETSKTPWRVGWDELYFSQTD